MGAGHTGLPLPRVGVTRGGGGSRRRWAGTESSSFPTRGGEVGRRGAGGARSEGLLPRGEGQDRSVGSLNHGQTPLRGSSGLFFPSSGSTGSAGRRKNPGGRTPISPPTTCCCGEKKKKSFPPGQGGHGWGESRAPRPALPVGAGLEDLFFHFRVPSLPPPPRNHSARPPTLLLRSRRAGAPDFID